MYIFRAAKSGISITSGQSKILMVLVPPTGTRMDVKEVAVTFRGASAQQEPLITLHRVVPSSAPTGGATITPIPNSTDQADTTPLVVVRTQDSSDVVLPDATLADSNALDSHYSQTGVHRVQLASPWFDGTKGEVCAVRISNGTSALTVSVEAVYGEGR